MKIRDWFIVISTFIVGFASGVYLYFDYYEPNYEPHGESAILGEVSDFNIIGLRYGTATEDSTFRLREDASYTYIPNELQTDTKSTGELPDKIMANLSAALTPEALATSSADLVTTRCEGIEIPVNYEYNIELDGVEYTLDTCTTTFTNDTQVGQALLQVWQYLSDPEGFRFTITNSPGGLEESDADVVENRSSWWSLRGYFERGLEEAGFERQ